MPRRIIKKWRPPLYLVLGGVLGAVLTAPLAGLLAVRFLSGTFGFRHAALLIAVLVIVMTAVLGYLLWRLILRPVTALAARAEALQSGDASTLIPLPHYGTRELRHLGQSVLDMAATLHNRTAAIRSFTDHVTHEFKTPLTAIRGAAELLDTGDASGENRQLQATILGATARMEQLLAALRQMAAAREPLYRGETSLSALLPTLSRDFPHLTFHSTGAQITLPLATQGLAIVLHHLSENAAEHGARQVTLAAQTRSDGPALTVSDDGAGISPGNRARVFQPFFTTKRDAGGTGMGLSIAHTLLQAHAATLRLADTNAGTGTHFVIEF